MKMQTSEKIKACRKTLGMTQQALGDGLSVSRKTISSWETGRSYPDVGSLIRLSKIFQVSLDDLLKDDRLVDHYNSQEKVGLQNQRMLCVTWCLNIVLVVMGDVNLFRPFNVHVPFLTSAVFLNWFILATHYDRWANFRRIRWGLGAVATMLGVYVITALTTMAVPLPAKWHSIAFFAGQQSSHYAAIMVLSFGVTSLLWMWPGPKKGDK